MVLICMAMKEDVLYRLYAGSSQAGQMRFSLSWSGWSLNRLSC